MLFCHAEESIFGLEAEEYLFFFQSLACQRGRKFMRRPCEILNLRSRAEYEKHVRALI
jgi:hypothetical protein